ncbi:MAG: hypothetical protein KatS3mg090_0145 [Patescibacteria group bacterium]|nr:MAG: hypothetical protein KatS3mg090_0145 [Patescibacteria group bacterium]
MNYQIVFEALRLIPKGKVVSYKHLAHILGLKSARLVSFYLRKNRFEDRFVFPCYKVVKSDGTLADGYLFFGKQRQKEYLFKDGVVFSNNKVATECFYKFNSINRLYFVLLKRYGFPGPWPWFGKDRYSFDEIIISSVLTQNTSWQNVEKSIALLRLKDACNLRKIISLSEASLSVLIRPSGFYTRKVKTLKALAYFILKNKMSYFKESDIRLVRKDLLSIWGVGPETADTILLYGFDRLIFPIDSYTKRFVQTFLVRYATDSYTNLQSLFHTKLAFDLDVYKNMHALITAWGKES